MQQRATRLPGWCTAVSQHPQVEAKNCGGAEEPGPAGHALSSRRPAPIQWDDIPRLTYLNAVIKVRLPLCICACLHSQCQQCSDSVKDVSARHSCQAAVSVMSNRQDSSLRLLP